MLQLLKLGDPRLFLALAPDPPAAAAVEAGMPLPRSAIRRTLKVRLHQLMQNNQGGVLSLSARAAHRAGGAPGAAGTARLWVDGKSTAFALCFRCLGG